jgi:hypothetical protein
LIVLLLLLGGLLLGGLQKRVVVHGDVGACGWWRLDSCGYWWSRRAARVRGVDSRVCDWIESLLVGCSAHTKFLLVTRHLISG